MRRDDGTWIELTTCPIEYEVGSGSHASSFLGEIDGFLVQSPITYFAANQQWRMSPGFENADQPGFGRAVNQGCLRCHAGRSEAVDRSYHRMQISEAAISCERCHGPGKRHVELHDALTASKPENEVRATDVSGTESERDPSRPDSAIVNPARLSRDLSDAICAQCHLQGVASVTDPGQLWSDYVPGTPLSTNRADFELEDDDAQMTVAGHFRQLRKSRCYTQSTMSCLTCHDVHETERDFEAKTHADRITRSRQVCLTCHQHQDCNFELQNDVASISRDRCIACHMPQSPTEVLHTAFTHHRIGIHHRDGPSPVPSETPSAGERLRLVESIPREWESEALRSRAYGIAYWELALSGRAGIDQTLAFNQSHDLLLEAWNAGSRDPELSGRLAFLGLMRNDPRSLDFIANTLDPQHRVVSGEARILAYAGRAQWYARRGRFGLAAEAMAEVVKLRRDSTDWQQLAQFLDLSGDATKATAAYERAMTISPANQDMRRALRDRCRMTGDIERAAFHASRLRSAQ